MDDPLAKLMGGLRIDDESFNEVMLESDEETEKKSNIEPETHPSIDNWISKVALKSKFEIILAILRCHFKDEKDIEILDMISGSFADPQLFAIYYEYHKNQVDNFFAKIKLVNFDSKMFEAFRCKILPFVAGAQVKNASGEEFDRQVKIFFRSYFHDHLSKHLEIEDNHEQLATIKEKNNFLAAKVFEPQFRSSIKKMITEKLVGTKITEKNYEPFCKVLEHNQKNTDEDDEDYDVMVAMNLKLQEQIQHLEHLKTQFGKLPEDRVKKLREMLHEAEFVSEIAQGVNVASFSDSGSISSSSSSNNSISFTDTSY